MSDDVEHLVPAQEDGHTLASDCRCQPFTYVRLRDGQEAGQEVRHNSFDALPVDEHLLEEVQDAHAHGDAH